MYRYTTIRNLAAGSILALLGITFGACHKSRPDSGANSQTTGRTVQEVLQGSFNVSLFNEALHYTGLDDSLKGGGPYTIFAPEDAAFDSLGIFSVAQIDTMDKVSLTHLLKYHILYGQNISRLQVNNGPDNPFDNWDGKTLYISRPFSGDVINNDNFIVNGDTVVQADILASNGVVHTLKTVLKYQTYNSCEDYLNADTSFSFFLTALHRFNLYSKLQSAGPITVLAPVNNAFRSVGIDLDSINRMDTMQYFPLLFTPYLLTNLRYFTGLENYGGMLNYYSADGTFQIQGNGYYDYTTNIFSAGVDGQAFDPGTHDLMSLFSIIDGNAYTFYSGTPGSAAAISSQNNPAGNGVVIVIQETLAGPDACRRTH
jgi:uncharacterized surface protein with fasciclin (FAS1) repeats